METAQNPTYRGMMFEAFKRQAQGPVDYEQLYADMGIAAPTPDEIALVTREGWAGVWAQMRHLWGDRYERYQLVRTYVQAQAITCGEMPAPPSAPARSRCS